MLSNYYYCCCSPSTLTFSRRPSRSSFLRCSIAATTTTKTSSPSPSLKPHLMIDFLTTSCGFSLDRVTKVTFKHFSHLKSTDKPNSFFGFMRSHGFNDTQIRKIVSCRPDLLCSNVDKTIAPKFKCFHDNGFSKSDIVHLIYSNPVILHSDFELSVLPKFQFWESLLGSKDNLVNVFKRYHGWLRYDPEKMIIPNISLLREYCGISNERIRFLLGRYPWLIIQKPEAMRSAIEHIEKNLGIPRQSGMFPIVLYFFLTTRKSNFDAKLKLMKSFGWSESEFLSAFCKHPNFVRNSEEVLSKKMGFLLKDVGCEPSEVASCPVLLMYSLQKRLIPRHIVIKFLESRGLIRKKCKVSSNMCYSNKDFMEKYVTPHKVKYPELLEMYATGCDGVSKH